VRWKGIIFIIVLISCGLFIGILFSNFWLEKKIEATGTSLNGARVDIDDLEFSLTDLFIRWNRLQITDPRNTMMNRIETGKCEFDLEFFPLLSKKIIVESFTITDIRTNTERSENGAIDEDEKLKIPSFLKETTEYLEGEVSSVATPQFSSLKKQANIDSIIKILDLTSITKISNLQKEIETTYQSWEKKFSGLKVDEDLKKVETRIKSIDVNNIKTADQYYAAAKKVDGIYKTINTASKDLTGLNKSLNSDIKKMAEQLVQVDDWIQEDYKRALSMAKIPDINAKNISKLIFGEKVVNQIITYIGYVASAREYTHSSQSEKPVKESPQRLKGQDIYFYNQNARPDFWIKKLNLSGYTETDIKLSGLISNIVSDQRQIGENTKIALKGNNDQGTEIALKGIFDYLTDQPSENFEFKYHDFSLADYQLSKSKLLPNKIKEGTGILTSKIGLSADQIEGEIDFTGKNLIFDMAISNQNLNEIEKIIQSAIDNISSVKFSAEIKGTSENLDLSIKSNLDDVLMNKIGSIVNERFEKARTDITRRVDSEINKHRAELDNLVSEKNELIQAQIQKYEQMLIKEKDLANKKKKEIEEIYKKEKSKIEDQIKDFFKP
jgi:uncharacterized protein (TIGR03545 family)